MSRRAPAIVDIHSLATDRVPQLIRYTAKQLAGAFYEMGIRSEFFRKRFPNPKLYVGVNWPLFVKPAKSTLVKLLADPKYPEHLKKPIAEAMVEDYNARSAIDRITVR